MVITNEKDFPDWDVSQGCGYCGHAIDRNRPFIERRFHNRTQVNWQILQLHQECAFRLSVLLENDSNNCADTFTEQVVTRTMSELHRTKGKLT